MNLLYLLHCYSFFPVLFWSSVYTVKETLIESDLLRPSTSSSCCLTRIKTSFTWTILPFLATCKVCLLMFPAGGVPKCWHSCELYCSRGTVLAALVCAAVLFWECCRDGLALLEVLNVAVWALLRWVRNGGKLGDQRLKKGYLKPHCIAKSASV